MNFFVTHILNLSNKKYWSWLLGVSVILLISIVLTMLLFSKDKKESLNVNHPEVLSGQAPPVPLVAEEVEDLKKITVLLLGYGGAGHQGGMLSDVIQLVHFDLEKKQVTAISIPRDLWAKLPNGDSAKINHTFSLGSGDDVIMSGGQLAKYMAGQVTGLDVDYFISVDFVGFKRLIGEVLNGIEVEVKEPLVDEWYPITGAELDTCGFTPDEVATLTANYSGFELERRFECRYEKLIFQPGVIAMQGDEAMKFVRSRHGSAGGDFSRSSRQHQVLRGIFEKIFSIDGLRSLPKLYKTAKYTFSTDITLDEVSLLAPLLIDLNNYSQETVVISTSNVLQNSKSSSGQFIVIPKAGMNNWQDVQNLISNSL